MLISMLIQHPQMLGTVLRHTPLFVWGLLAALVALGLSQARARTASLARITLTPVGMTAFAVWGMFSAFGASPAFGDAMLVWLLAAAWALAAVAMTPAPRGASFDPQTRRITLPGSWIPLALFLGIFLTKYIVGVDLAMQPSLAREGDYALVVAALYGAFSGILTGRSARLLLRQPRLATAPQAS